MFHDGGEFIFMMKISHLLHYTNLFMLMRMNGRRDVLKAEQFTLLQSPTFHITFRMKNSRHSNPSYLILFSLGGQNH